MNEVHGKQDRLGQDSVNRDREKKDGRKYGRVLPGQRRVKLPLMAVGAALVLLAAAGATLAFPSLLRSSFLLRSSSTPAAAEPSSQMLEPGLLGAAKAKAGGSGVGRPSPVQVSSALSALPLMFEANIGQSDPRVKFMARGIGARGLGYGVFLTADGATMSLLSRDRNKRDSNKKKDKKEDEARTRVEALRMRLAGANPNATVTGMAQLPGKSNYFLGNDPSRWQRDVPQFARVRYEDIYPGINLVFYGSHGQMEYDFQVVPGADPARAELEFEGSKRIELRDGNLILHATSGIVRLQAPHVYQRVADRERPVEGRFEMRAGNRVGFAVGAYDHSRELVIDPVLDYSTYFGGTGDEESTSIAVDGGGNMYLTGSTTSAGLPIPAGTTPFQATLNGAQNVYVLKINAAGTSAAYLTYLGGSGTDTPAGIAVDASGNAYVAGTTSSPNFPTTATNAYQSTVLTGSTGTSHVFVTALDLTGSTLHYSSYLSGNGTDVASGMTIDANQDVFVTGSTTSTNSSSAGSGSSNDQFPASFPPETQAFQQFSRAAIQFFVTKVNTAAFGIGSIPYSTYFGGGTPSNGTAVGGGIAVDGKGNIYFSGTTNFLFTGQSSATDFPILNAYQPCLNTAPPTINTNPQSCTNTSTSANTDAFVADLNPNVSNGSQLLWSTYFGGSQNDSSTGVALDTGAASVFIVGTTNSPDITTLVLDGYQTCLNTAPGTSPCTGTGTATDAFVAKFGNLSTTTTTTTTNVLGLTYFSYLGGSGNDAGLAITVDSADDAYLTGWTQSTDFPIFPNQASNPLCAPPSFCVLQGALKGTQDAFFAHLGSNTSTTSSGQGSQGVYATYFGGTGINQGTSLTIDNSSNVYLAGDTNAPDFQTQNPLQATNNGGYDAFAAKFSPQADLGVTGVLTQSSTQGYVGAGNSATFTYTVSNSGPDLATQVTFSDNFTTSGIPVTFVSATAGNNGTCSATTSNGTAVCTIPALQADTSTTVTVVVTPTIAGNFTGGSVTVYSPPPSNDPNPANNNTSVPAKASDFAAAINPVNQAVGAAGDTASYQVTITPTNPYPSGISLTCCTNLPSSVKGTFSLSSVTLTGTNPVSAQLNITTTARTSTAAGNRGLRQFYALWLTLPGMAVVGIGWKSKRRWRIVMGIAVCLAFGSLLLQPACGGATTPTPTAGTPTGTYTMVATATSGTDTKNITFTLTVP